MNEAQPDPPRRPLRVWVASEYRVGADAPLTTAGWRILDPADPDYEAVYQEAVAAHIASGAPMPYPEEGEDGEATDVDTL